MESIVRLLDAIGRVSLFDMRDASIDVEASRTGNKDLYSCFFRIVPPPKKKFVDLFPEMREALSLFPPDTG